MGGREDLLIEDLPIGRGPAHKFLRVVAGPSLRLWEPSFPSVLRGGTAEEEQAEENKAPAPAEARVLRPHGVAHPHDAELKGEAKSEAGRRSPIGQ